MMFSTLFLGFSCVAAQLYLAEVMCNVVQVVRPKLSVTYAIQIMSSLLFKGAVKMSCSSLFALHLHTFLN